VTLYLSGYASPRGAVLTVSETPAGLAVESTAECAADPTYLALAPDGRTLYALHELDRGLLSAFAVRDRGALRPLGSRPSGGAGPCHLSVHPTGRFVLTAHWGSGEFAAHPVAADGSLGEAVHVLPTGKASAHMIRCDPSGRWVLAVHLGLGTVTTYRLDSATGRLTAHAVASLPPTAGPRHLDFDPVRPDRLYVVNELHSTLTAASFDVNGGVVSLGETVSTLPAGVRMTNHPSAVRVSPDGRFVYVANRFHDSVAVFATGPGLRLLATYPCGGQFPRDLAPTRDGGRLHVANQNSGTVVTFTVEDGVLTRVGDPFPLAGAACILPVAGSPRPGLPT
jgi:6-phosphogluconolactonase